MEKNAGIKPEIPIQQKRSKLCAVKWIDNKIIIQELFC